MSLPLQINDSLFWQYKGKVNSTWGLGCGDGFDDDMRLAYVEWCQDKGCDGIIILLNNEGYVSLFRDHYMGSVDMGKYNKLIQYCQYLKSNHIKIVFAFYDGPEIRDGKYWPIISQLDKHEAFMQAACQALNQYASAYLIGCETNRYWTPELVNQAIWTCKKYAGLIPVGSHEQWNPVGRKFVGGDFCCYETRNHPKDGDAISVKDMVDEIKYIQTFLPAGFPVWVSEFNWSDSSRAIAQARALAALPGVVGVGGPL